MYVVPLNTPLKKYESLKSTDKFKSRRAGYRKQWRYTMSGYLVMSFLSDIKHPAVEVDVIHRNYILVGIIRSFVSIEWDTGMTDEDWNSITMQGRLNVFWGKIPRWNKSSSNNPSTPHIRTHTNTQTHKHTNTQQSSEGDWTKWEWRPG